MQAADNYDVQGLFQKFKFMQSSTKHFNILEDVSAIIPPGRMTLLLGPPGSGKSTLLAALAGKLQSSNLKVSTFTPSLNQASAFISPSRNPLPPGLPRPTALSCPTNRPALSTTKPCPKALATLNKPWSQAPPA